MPPVDLAALKAAVRAVTTRQRQDGAMGWMVAWTPEIGAWFQLNGFEPGDNWGFYRGHWFEADQAARAQHAITGAQDLLHKWQRERRPGEVGGPPVRNGWCLATDLAEAEERAELVGWERVY